MNRKRKLLFCCTATFSLLKALLSVGFAFMLKSLLDYFGTGARNEIYKQMVIAIVFLAVYILVEIIYNFLESKYITRQVKDLKNTTMATVLRSSIISFNNRHSGEYLSMLTNDAKAIEDDYYGSIFECISMVLSLVVSVVALIWLSPVLGIVSILATTLSMVLPIILSNKLNSIRGDFSSKQDFLTRKTKGILDGFETIKTYGVEELALDDYSESVTKVEQHNRTLKFLLQSSAAIGRLMAYLVFFVIVFTGLLLSIQGEITFGVLLASIQLSNNLVSPIVSGVQRMTKIKSVKDIRGKFSQVKDKSEQAVSQDDIQFNKKIALHDVSFSYDSEKDVLNNISIDIEKGKKYAVVGASGSGKSTLGKIIMGVFECYGGEILLDGSNIAEYDSNAIIKLFSVINQNTFLFDDTIANNISFYKDLSVEKINQALAKVQLSHFIGNTEPIGENGVLLSGGEKQRLSLARAFVNDCPIILLDEATSQLDNENMMKIETLVLSSTKTVITITHRLTEKILQKYDTIFVMSQGKVVEQGKYDDLMSQKGLLYSLYYISGQ